MSFIRYAKISKAFCYAGSAASIIFLAAGAIDLDGKEALRAEIEQNRRALPAKPTESELKAHIERFEFLSKEYEHRWSAKSISINIALCASLGSLVFITLANRSIQRKPSE